MKVPYFDLPSQIKTFRPELEAAIGRCLDTGAFCLGPEVKQFETEFAAFCGAGHCVALNSGTSALHIAMRLLDLGPGDEVITTPFTFIAPSWAIVYTGARPVFVDVDKATLNLDPALVERAITHRTKALLPVHLYGHPCDLASLMDISQRRNLPLVEDAAQAHGALYGGKPVGTFGAMSAFSFYPTKNLGACGEGGALVTNRDDFAARARALREHGSTARYLHNEVGYITAWKASRAPSCAQSSRILQSGTSPGGGSPTGIAPCSPTPRSSCPRRMRRRKAFITSSQSGIPAATA